MTTMMAKELMLGIKDSVDDVSSAFKKMAFLKPQTATDNLVIFADDPVALDPVQRKAVPLVEFTFGNDKTITFPTNQKAIAEDKNQFTLFDYMEDEDNVA
jgi:hypothetical protein